MAKQKASKKNSPSAESQKHPDLNTELNPQTIKPQALLVFLSSLTKSDLSTASVKNEAVKRLAQGYAKGSFAGISDPEIHEQLNLAYKEGYISKLNLGEKCCIAVLTDKGMDFLTKNGVVLTASKSWTELQNKLHNPIEINTLKESLLKWLESVGSTVDFKNKRVWYFDPVQFLSSDIDILGTGVNGKALCVAFLGIHKKLVDNEKAKEFVNKILF
jgi:hypothetical protein